MIIIGIILSVVALGFLCGLLFMLAVHALPFLAGATAALCAYHTGSGPIGAVVVGVIVGFGHPGWRADRRRRRALVAHPRRNRAAFRRAGGHRRLSRDLGPRPNRRTRAGLAGSFCTDRRDHRGRRRLDTHDALCASRRGTGRYAGFGSAVLRCRQPETSEGLAVLSSWMCASSGSRVAECDREGLRFLHSG